MIEKPSTTDPVVHFEYIDALRGMAFLLVLLIHAHIWANMNETRVELALSKLLHNGIYGVQLFYLISAFTLFQSMDARSRRDIHPTRAFFARRFFRIAPLFWTAIFFYLIWYGLGPRKTAPDGISASNIVLTSLFLHGWHPVTINSVVPGGWSIAVEMVFYLTLPILYRWFHSPRRIVLLLFATLVITNLNYMRNPQALIYPDWQARDQLLMTEFNYYWLPSQFPVFVLGLLLYTLRRATKPGPGGEISVDRGPLCWSLFGLFVALMATAIASFPKHIVIAIAFCLMAWALSIQPNRIVVNRATCYLGKISFSAYLMHFAVLDITTRMLGIVPTDIPIRSWFVERYIPVLLPASTAPGPIRFVLILAIALPLTALLSTLTYRLIEEPGMRLGKLVIRKAGW